MTLLVNLHDCYKSSSSKEEFIQLAMNAYGRPFSYEGSIFSFIKEFMKEHEDHVIDWIHALLASEGTWPIAEMKAFFIRDLEIKFFEYVCEDYTEEHRNEIEEFDYMKFLDRLDQPIAA